MDEYLAIVKLFAGPFDPQGYFSCDGRLLPIAQYQALYSLLETRFGGDARTTFALPDMRPVDTTYKVTGTPDNLQVTAVSVKRPWRPNEAHYIICAEGGMYPMRP